MLSRHEIQRAKSLQMKKHRRDTGLFLVEGRKMVRELLQSGYRIHAIYALDETPFEAPSSLLRHASREEMERMSALDTAPDVLGIAEQKRWGTFHPGDVTATSEVILVLDGLADPGNLGTIIRTAEWFGVRNMVCSENCVELYNPKVVQATMGSLFRMTVYYQNLETFLGEAQSRGLPTYGATLDGQNVREVPLATPGILVIGSESHGISPPVLAKLDHRVSIPGKGRAESLNAAVATGVLLSMF